MTEHSDLKLLIIFFTKDLYFQSHRVYDKLSDEDRSRLFDLLVNFKHGEVKENCECA